jgi:pimeloyl-ACP methyl ester carboxylesterase
MIWRQDGAEMLDKLGPSIIVTHSAGGPFGWIVAEARPNLVKGIIAIEGAGAPFQGQNIWGLSDVPVAYDPPVSDPAQIKLKRVTPEENIPGINPYNLQEEPAHKLKNLLNIPVALVTAEGSCIARQPRCGRIPEAGGRQGRRAPHGEPEHPRQRPHDDGREEQP